MDLSRNQQGGDTSFDPQLVGPSSVTDYFERSDKQYKPTLQQIHINIVQFTYKRVTLGT